jgi:thioredoxin-related protein
MLSWVASAAVALSLTGTAQAQQPSPHAIELPSWFVETFLDLREDVREATQGGKRLLIYFGQDGCPYCKLLMQTSFTDTRIVELASTRFLPVALNLWGDRELTWVDGRRLSEKQLGAMLKVQFTPTVLIFNEMAEVIVRLNGYQPPPRMEAALKYASQRIETKESLAEYLQRVPAEAASPSLHPEPFFMKPPYKLNQSSGRPVLVLFERTNCSSCDELHQDGLRRKDVARLLGRFEIARFEPRDASALVTPQGQRTTVAAWAQDLKIAYAPTLVFFDTTGLEVFRAESYLRPFHLASVLEYVASGAYRTEPSFQRYVQARADRLRAGGEAVDLWK